MIGIVVVSHSRALARAAAALAAEMVEESARPAVALAAGLDEDTFGTDAAAVAEAIGGLLADGADGVLVLLDLGSAVLSAELALELLDPEAAARVRLSSAPLVEGLVAAVVTAASGADLRAVAAEAARGAHAKAEHLGEGAGPAQETGAESAQSDRPGEGSTTVVEVLAPHGLHARPAARLVREFARFDGVRVGVRNLDTGGRTVDARSISGLATLGARQGHRLELRADGAQAEDALKAIRDLAATGFGDLEAAAAGGAGGAVVREKQPVTPTAAGSGLEAALGPVVRLRAAPDPTAYRPGPVREEAARLEAALVRAREEVTAVRDRTAAEVGAGEAAILDAHLALLEDPGLVPSVREAVAGGASALDAWGRRVGELRAEVDAVDDPYLRDRGQDVSAVGDRVLRALLGEPDTTTPPVRGVLVLDELDPTTAGTLDPDLVQAVVTVRGGATGHGVLLARARGIPVLTGLTWLADVTAGTMLAVDARTGRVVVDPDEGTTAQFEQVLRDRTRARGEALHRAQEPARTTDGHLVPVKTNVGVVADAVAGRASGADGAGLVRTEVLFADHAEPPEVTEQVTQLTAVAEALEGRPVTVRTWDVGGDKPLPFLPLPREGNPFLGERGIRAFRDRPDLLVDQLEAICRVAADRPLRVMFPMVATVAEVDFALARLDEAAARAGGGRPVGLEVGIMVEVPAAALRASTLTAGLDFVSIGSNDLTQYVMAAERGNAKVDALADPADPAVLALIAATCEGVADGVQVGVCGDAAGDPLLAGLLIGLGVSELSVGAAAVPAVKAALRQVSLGELQDLAHRALRCGSAAEVRALLAPGRHLEP